LSKKDPLIHFPFYCNQYMGMMAKYTYEEQGAFIRVLATYIAEDGQVSCSSQDSRYRLFSAFTPGEQQALDNVFKCATELAKEIVGRQKFIREKRRESGRKGGRPADPKPEKKPKKNTNQMDNQTVYQTDKQKETEREPITETETETETEPEKNLHQMVSIKNVDGSSIRISHENNFPENICQLCKEPFVDGHCPTCGWEGDF